MVVVFKVTVPGELTALMSAERTGEETVAGKKTCSFQQKVRTVAWSCCVSGVVNSVV